MTGCNMQAPGRKEGMQSLAWLGLLLVIIGWVPFSVSKVGFSAKELRMSFAEAEQVVFPSVP